MPKLVDSIIEQRGGTRLVPIGVTDCADGDMFSDFETWEDEVLWPALAEKYSVAEVADGEATLQPSLVIEVTTPRSSTLRQDVKEALVVATKDLTAPGAPAKKHEIQLPSGLHYSAGDYLSVLPINPRENVTRAMRRFQLPWDALITISADGQTTLPTDTPIPATDVLGAYVELAQPATKRVRRCLSLRLGIQTF